MRILFVPFDNFHLNSNEHVPDRIHLLAGKNKLIGVRREVNFTRGMPGLSAYVRFFAYSVRVFAYGLKHRKEYDLIYCFELGYTVVGVAISAFTGKPCVRDCAGVPWEWVQRVKPPLFLRAAIALSEKIAKRFARIHIVLSDADAKAYIEHGYNPDKVVSIPLLADFYLPDNIIADKAKLRKQLNLDVKSRILIFTGQRAYPPNMEAAEWINRTLAPAVNERLPGTIILMTGKGEKPVPIHPSIVYTGFVPNFFEYICAADVLIAPIEMPSGRLTKVFDSLASSIPNVVLESATNGIPELKDGENAMIAKDRAEFIEKTVYLLEHPSEAREIGVRGRKMLEEHYNWDYWEDKLNQALETCLKSKTKKGRS